MYFLWNYLFVMVLITEDMVVEGMWLVDVGLPSIPSPNAGGHSNPGTQKNPLQPVFFNVCCIC